MSEPSSAAGPDPDENVAPVASLAHEAGLAAGRTRELRPGVADLDRFELRVAENGATVLSARREPIAVEGIIVADSAGVEDGDVIQLQSDHFTLRTDAGRQGHITSGAVSPRSIALAERPSVATWLWFFAAVVLIGLVAGLLSSSALFGLTLIGLGGIVAVLAVARWIHRRRIAEETRQRDNARRLFFTEVVDARHRVASEQRATARTPATIADLVQHAVSDQRPVSDQRLEVTIASGDRSWEPQVVCHRDPGWDHRAVIDELSFLPAIPFGIDLDDGALAIVGPRHATLAVARHVATSAQALSGATVTVNSAVPADWRWLGPFSSARPGAGTTPDLVVFDETIGAPRARTVFLAPSLDALGAIEEFMTLMWIDPAGNASIVHQGQVAGDGFVPHGISDEHAADLCEAMFHGRSSRVGAPSDISVIADLRDTTIDLRDSGNETFTPLLQPLRPLPVLDDPTLQRFDTDRLLVTGLSRARNGNVLATAALRQAARFSGRALFVLDRGDRALIRLSQLDGCVAYASIDQVDRVIRLIDAVEASRANDQADVLLLAPDLWGAIGFYRNSGFAELADRLDDLIAAMDVIPVAASAATSADLPTASFLVWVDTNDPPLVADSTGDDPEPLDLATLPGLDLTGSVAQLVRSQELPS